MLAFDENHLWPLMTQSSPSFSARVVSVVGSEPAFFERHYDRRTLHERLLSTELADVVDLSYWGEGAVRMERILARLGPLRAPLYPLEGVLAILLRPLDPDDGGHPMAAFLTLRRR